jgi:hypothetical protein
MSFDAVYLSDDQHAAIERAADALNPLDRIAFKKALGHRLRGETTVGDGSLYRTIKEVLAEGHYRLATSTVVGARGTGARSSKLVARKPILA